MIDPAKAGYWDGDRYVLHEPIILGGRTFKGLDCSGMAMEGGITRDDVVHAVLNAVYVEDFGDGAEGWGPCA